MLQPKAVVVVLVEPRSEPSVYSLLHLITRSVNPRNLIKNQLTPYELSVTHTMS